MTPLMYAAQMGEHEILQLFIDEQADVNAQDNRGWTVSVLFTLLSILMRSLI